MLYRVHTQHDARHVVSTQATDRIVVTVPDVILTATILLETQVFPRGGSWIISYAVVSAGTFIPDVTNLQMERDFARGPSCPNQLRQGGHGGYGETGKIPACSLSTLLSLPTFRVGLSSSVSHFYSSQIIRPQKCTIVIS